VDPLGLTHPACTRLVAVAAPQAPDRSGRALLVGVGLVYADTAVLALALPDVLADLHASVRLVAATLVVFAAAVAVGVPLASLALRRRGPRPVAVAALTGFAVAALLAGVAPGIGVLLAARGMQGLAGGALLAAAVHLVTPRATAVALGVGTALGPAAGGLLTGIVSWRLAFLAQVPLALAAAVLTRHADPSGREVTSRHGRAASGVDIGRGLLREGAGGLLAGGLLTLQVLAGLLTVDVWEEPTVIAVGLQLLVAAGVLVPLLVRSSGGRLGAAGGALVLAGALVSLGLLPGRHAGLLALAMLLGGLGVGLARRLLDPGAAGATPAGAAVARHVGIVLAAALAGTLLAGDLTPAADRASVPVAAEVLRADLTLAQKVPLTVDLYRRSRSSDTLPQVLQAFATVPAGAPRRAAQRAVTATLQDVVTTAWHGAFLAGAGLAGAALLLALLAGSGGSGRPWAATALLVALGVAATAALAVGTDRAGDRVPVVPATSCGHPLPAPATGGIDGVLQTYALRALDAAACQLGTNPAALVLQLAGAGPGRLTQQQVCAALDTALRRAVREGAGPLGGLASGLLDREGGLPGLLNAVGLSIDCAP